MSAAELADRARRLAEMLSPCELCPHNCAVARDEDERGLCQGGLSPKVSSYNLHFGEEPCLVGRGGSGTIFLAGCNLGCIFCQNYPISHFAHGREVGTDELAAMMLSLQRSGAENINFVTPTHFSAQIIAAVAVARENGLHLPLVWNTGGYERLEVIRLLNGIVDIYLPDAKYADNTLAGELCNASDYVEYNRAALTEMWRQVGPLEMHGAAAVRGLLVRHLVLPGRLASTRGVLEFLAGLDKEKRVAASVMAQYFPAFRAVEDPTLNKRVTRAEWKQVQAWVDELGISEGYVQDR
jgi:putative pyruvate formate lyase activating enzyme